MANWRVEVETVCKDGTCLSFENDVATNMKADNTEPVSIQNTGGRDEQALANEDGVGYEDRTAYTGAPQ